MDEQTTVTVAPKASLLSKLKGISKKTRIIIAASAVVLLGGGSAFAYSALQSPEAVVGLALASAFTGAHPSGNLDVNAQGAMLNGDASMSIYTADAGAGLKLNLTATVVGQPVGATLNVVSAKNGDLYLNLADFDTLGTYLTNSGTLDATTEALYANALKGVWLKVSKTDLQQYTGGNDCLSNKLDNAEYTKSLSTEMQSALRNNLFIVPTKELAGVNGDRVFSLGINADKLKGFLKALQKTKYYGDLQTCVPGFGITDSQIDSISQTDIDNSFKQAGISITLYAKGGWSPSMDKLVIAGGVASSEKITVTYTPTGDQSSKVVIPSKSETITELFASLMGGTY